MVPTLVAVPCLCIGHATQAALCSLYRVLHKPFRGVARNGAGNVDLPALF